MFCIVLYAFSFMVDVDVSAKICTGMYIASSVWLKWTYPAATEALGCLEIGVAHIVGSVCSSINSRGLCVLAYHHSAFVSVASVLDIV